MKPCAKSAARAPEPGAKWAHRWTSANAFSRIEGSAHDGGARQGYAGAARGVYEDHYAGVEKLRLSRVRQQSVRRIGEIEARCEEIGIEKAALLAAMEAPPESIIGVRQGAQSSQSRRSRGVSLKY